MASAVWTKERRLRFGLADEAGEDPYPVGSPGVSARLRAVLR